MTANAACRLLPIVACFATSAPVDALAQLSASVSAQQNVRCFGGSDGSATIAPTGGTPPYAFVWSPSGGNAATATGLSARVYSVTVADSATSSVVVNVTISQPPPVGLTPASQTNVACSGASSGSASVAPATGGLGGYVYDWSPGAPVGDGTTGVSGLAAGLWTSTVRDSAGCTASVSFFITEPPAISVVTAAQTDVACHGGANGAASIETPTGGVGGFAYNWSPGNPSGDGTLAVSGLVAREWTVVVTDANGCSKSHAVMVTEPPDLTLTPTLETDVSCHGRPDGAASVAAAGGVGDYSFDWTPGTPQGDGTNAVSALGPGVWIANVTDGNGCSVAQAFTITEPTDITFGLAAQTNPACVGLATGSATVNAAGGGTGGFSYDWAPGTPNGDGTTTVTGLTVGSYTVTATDATSCSKQLIVNVSAPQLLTLTPSANAAACFGQASGNAQVVVSGGNSPYVYDWSPGSPTGDGSEAITQLRAGDYTVFVSDADGCAASEVLSVGEPPELLANGSSQGTSAVGVCDGSAAVAPSGGVAPYDVLWTPQLVATTSVADQCAGITTATVTDAQGCATSVSFDLSAPTFDLGVGFGAQTEPVNAGAVTTVRLAVSSVPAAPEASISITVPEGLEVLAVIAPTTWLCSEPSTASATLTCSIGGVVADAALNELAIEARVAELFGHGPLTVVATVSSFANDPVSTNNTASSTLAVVSPAKLVAMKTAEQTDVGVRYVITVRNDGPAAALELGGETIVDTLPAGLVLIGAIASAGTVVAADGRVAWTGILRAFETVMITIDTVFAPSVEGGVTLRNQALVTYDSDGDGIAETTDGSSPDGGESRATELVVSAAGGCGGCRSSSGHGLALLIGMVTLLRRARLLARANRATTL